MTKEELKKEAIKYAVDYPSSCGKGYMHKDLRIAYLAGAEPREKQIQIDAEQIRALQKQNGELTDKLTKAKQFIRDFLSVAVDYICPIDKNYSLIAEAEQFIKEE